MGLSRVGRVSVLLLAIPVAMGGCRDSSGVSVPEGSAKFRLPLLVALSFDDNYDSEGMEWAVELLAGRKNADGTPVRCSFMVNTVALEKGGGRLRAAWRKALAAGHEIGNHTHDHNMGRDATAMTEEEWRATIGRCHAVLTAPAGEGGIGLKKVWGFRAPRGELNDEAIMIINEMGYSYDSSRPGHWSAEGKWPGKVPGTEMWDLAISWLEPAPEARSLAQRVSGAVGFPRFVLGVDMSLFSPDAAGFTKEQALATLEHSLDLRRKGARAPLVFVGHTQIMAAAADGDLEWKTTARQRREFYCEFLDHAGALPDVRVVSNGELVSRLSAASRR